MKTITVLGLLFACSTLHAQIQGTNGLPSPTPYTIVSQQANEQLWQQQTYEQGPNGIVVTNIHKVVEVTTGLNHLVNGQWIASSENITISPDGSSASATNGQHQVYFPGNIYNGDIEVVMPDGQIQQSQPLGLSYSDGSNSVLLAAATNSTGAILPTGNQVIYTNAFAGLDADLLYTYTKGGFEQDVILRQQPPDPGSLGLNAAQTRLQLLTEFVSTPQPGVTAATNLTAAGNLEDDTLNFGTMAMGMGKAFLLGASSPSVNVEKRWQTLNGRQFLIEEVPIVSIAEAIDTLPPYLSQASIRAKPVISKSLILPPRRLVHASPTTRFLAQAISPNHGLVLDYQLLNSSQTNYTFAGDTTYYISGTVNLYGTNTFEGGAVIKYTNGASINLSGSPFSLLINCRTGPYRPVIFTARNDNTVGETISGSTGNPTNYYANPALGIQNSSAQTFSNFRIAYAHQGISVANNSAVSFYNGQLVNCQNGVTLASSPVYLRNVLFANVATNFNETASSTADVQNGTFNNIGYLAADSANNALTLDVTNCVLANVTNLFAGTYTNAFGGDFNGFYNCPSFGSDTTTNSSYPFQTVGGGAYYLADECAFFNSGTNKIDPVLLTNLQTRTTYPPIIYTNITFTNVETFSPQAQRDTDTPDLGYHYYPLDYSFGGCFAYSNITFSAGTAVGWFRTTSGFGLYMHTNSIASFQGTVTAPDYWVRLNTVQENDTSAGSGPGGLTGGDNDQSNYQIAGAAEVHLSFTRCSIMSAGGNHFRDDSGYLVIRANHSEFYGGGIGGYILSCYFTNCLMDRMYGAQIAGWPGDEYILRNCTWIGAYLQFQPYQSAIPLSVRDCTFEGTTFSIANYGSGTNADYDYNAYTNGAPQLTNSGIHDVTVTTYDWRKGPLGNYYLPSISSLIDKGDVLASALGLAQFTTQTNLTLNPYLGVNTEVPECEKSSGGNVDIGYHYVAVDANGNPIDSNSDGIPDYIEDANGNGVVDSGEIDWTIPGDVGLKVFISRPRNGSVLP